MSVSINAICRKDRINQNRTTNIYLRFTVNRRSRYVSTGINIPAGKSSVSCPLKPKRFSPLKTFNNAPLKSLDRWGYYYFRFFSV